MGMWPLWAAWMPASTFADPRVQRAAPRQPQSHCAVWRKLLPAM